jgi:hypothetical protein
MPSNAVATTSQSPATTKPKASQAVAPRLPESLRRLLADPLSLEGDPAPAMWQAPDVPPESSTLRAARHELERALQPAARGHMEWCVNKLFVLPTRAGTAQEAAFQADNFIDACGHFPDDLWTAATLKLLQTKKFRPVPAEMVEVIGHDFTERQRMLERIRVMLQGKPALPAPAQGQQKFVPLTVKLRELRKERDAKGDAGELFAAAWCERSLALQEKRPIEQWARDFFDQHGWSSARSQSAIDSSKSAYRALQKAGLAGRSPAPERPDDADSLDMGAVDPVEPPPLDAAPEWA